MKALGRSLALQDLRLVALGVGLFWLMAVQLELSERLARWLQTKEWLQLDEMPLTLLLLSLGLLWFAARRVHEVSGLLARNRLLTQRLLSAQESERRLLAQELHDEVGQACVALRVEAACMAQVAATSPEAVLAAAQRIDSLTLRMHSLARDMLKRLRPPDLDSQGLEASLSSLCRSWQTQHHLACHLHIQTPSQALPDALSIALYRLTQEALTNIAKHACASEVRIDLAQNPRGLTLRISDNGAGVPPSPLAGEARHQASGLGWIGMQERVASLQGEIFFENAQPGLTVRVQLPWQPALGQAHA